MKKIIVSVAAFSVLLSFTAKAQSVTGSGTTNTIPKFTATSTIGNSIMVESSSKIGVSTSSPVNKLHVETASSNDGIRVNQTGTTGAVLYLQNSNTSFPGRTWSLFSTGHTNGQGNEGNFLLYDGSVTRLFVRGSTGNMALGAFVAANHYDPMQPLHLTGNMLIDGTSSSLFFGEGAYSSAVGEYGLEYMPGGLNFWKPYGAPSNGTLINYILFLNDQGRVGINTNNPTAQLTVNGKTLIGDPATVTLPGSYNLYVQGGILTDKVRVAVVNSSNWMDGVFAKSYRLRPLGEVEHFILENSHLPEVPSACEVEEKGIDMAEMDATLLKKIEELTLYAIEQQKQIEQLKTEVEALRKNDSNH